MSKTIYIGCRLPSGLIIDLPGVAPVVLAGQRQAQERSPIIMLSADDYGVTKVDAEFWAKWKEHVGKDFAPLKSGAIFESKSEKDAKAINDEIKDEKTGHEPLAQTDGKVEKAD